jgi:hypothetical protein
MQSVPDSGKYTVKVYMLGPVAWLQIRMTLFLIPSLTKLGKKVGYELKTPSLERTGHDQGTHQG